MDNRVIVTGISGQDGAYLSQTLIQNGYRVVGITRHLKTADLSGLRYLGIQDQVELVACDLLDKGEVESLIGFHRPRQIFHLSAISSVAYSYQEPELTLVYNVKTTQNLLDAILKTDHNIGLFHAASSEMFGNIAHLPARLNDGFNPVSPYAVSKLQAHELVSAYRSRFGLKLSSTILFNHESYLRPPNFFVKKVIRHAVAMKHGDEQELLVGNLMVKRDFGFAPKYMEAVFLIMESGSNEDFLICSGSSISLNDFVESVFDKLSLDTSLINVDEALFRKADLLDIYGDPEKATSQLNWKYDLSVDHLIDILIVEELKNYPKRS